MAEHHTSHGHTNGPRGIGHETTDVNIWAIGKFGIGLVIITLLSVGLLVGVFQFFQSREDRVAKAIEPAKVFPSPRLLVDEPKTLTQYRADEDKVVNGYGWVDQSKGVVRIPVDQAMDLLVKRGLPVRQQTATPVSGVSIPTESGLGVVPAKQEEPEHHDEKAKK
jgi:hypothetical protein